MIEVGTDCTGIGSPEQALKNLSIDHIIKFACEKDPFARKSYLANHVCEIMYDDIVTRDNKTTPQVDLYLAGFPCQAFSNIGLKRGFDDIRGTIFFNCADYIRVNQPKVFVLENVKGLVSHDRPKGSKQKHGRTFSTMLNVLASTINGQQQLPFYEDNLGYHVFFRVLDTKDYGLPQSRERIFIVGIRPDVLQGRQYQFPSTQRLNISLADYLEPDVDEKYFLTEQALQRISSDQSILTSGSPIVINDRGALKQREIFQALDSNYNKGMDNHGQRSYVLVSKTVRTQEAKDIRRKNLYAGKDYHPFQAKQMIFVDQAYMNCLKTRNDEDNLILVQNRVRRLTPRECFRLQGHPDAFKFVVSESQLYKQAGNSISVPVIQGVIQNALPFLS